MKYLAFLAISLLFLTGFSLSVNAQVVETETDFFPILDGHYIDDQDNNSVIQFCGQDLNQSIPHFNGSQIFMACSVQPVITNYNHTRGLWKYNFSFLLDKVIVNATWTFNKVGDACSNPPLRIRKTLNETWDSSSIITTALVSDVTQSYVDLSAGLSNGENVLLANLNNAETAQAIYNDTNGILSFQSDTQTSTCLSGGDTYTIDTGAYFTFNTRDVITGFVNTSGVSEYYFDFESRTGSETEFDGADFKYERSTASIIPISNGQFIITAQTPEDDLLTTSCPDDGYDNVPIQGINTPNYDKICFDLSSDHNGKGFTGQIKVVNSTSPEFDFFFGFYAPTFNSFENIQFNPLRAERFRNLTISWETTIPMTSELRFSFVDPSTGNQTGFFILRNDSAFRTQHSLTIPEENMEGTFYEYFFRGFDSSSNAYNSELFNFTTKSFQLQIADVERGIAIITKDAKGKTISSLVTITGFSGAEATNALNEILPNGTAGQSLQVAFFEFRNETQHFGKKNMTVSSFGYETLKQEIDVDTNPFFLTVYLNPENVCTFVQQFNDNTSCVSFMNVSSLVYQQDRGINNVTSWVCNFDPDACQTFDTQGNPVCGQIFESSYKASGLWVGYACVGNFTFKNLGIVNGTIPAGFINPNQAQASLLPAFTDIFASLLGISGSAFLSFLSILISGIIGLLAGFKTKSGLVTGIIVFTFLFSFFFIGWLPTFVLIFIGVIVAFLIARFFVGQVSSSGE